MTLHLVPNDTNHDGYNAVLGAYALVLADAERRQDRMLAACALVGLTMLKHTQPASEPPSYRCATCTMVSYNPRDVEQRFCGRCKRWSDGSV